MARAVTIVTARVSFYPPIPSMRGEFLDLSDARLYYYAAGTRGAGEPVVFLHGFATSGHLWGDVVPLMPAGHRLVIVDLLGYGRSDRPLNRAVDLRGHAERMIELLDELRIDRACIVGHGMGGGIAQSLAIHHPRRVSRLCLVDSIAFDTWPTLGARLARATLPLTRFLPPALFVSALHRKLARGYRDASRAAHSIDLYLRPFAGADGRDALVAHIRALASGERGTLPDGLATIAAPTAIVCGRHDGVVAPSAGHRLQAAIAHATLSIIPDAKNFAPEEAPRRVADVIGELLAR
jgi:pimeloyl-ACP methyl ester carboxylesterase